VGLPLSLEFAVHYPVLGFDINAERVSQLNQGVDITLEAEIEKLNDGLKNFKDSNGGVGYMATNTLADIAEANIFIVTVPTP
ncbi:MAG TPA: Vi polysaccharide biosynthesis protein VipA/TviB, partial [Chryseobacterium indologenes]|nr:Vi polysaccharide biosynthesis protein VipA/TviB [Chryseobacterium indologenes]